MSRDCSYGGGGGVETRPQWHVAFLSSKWGEMVLFEVGSCLRGGPCSGSTKLGGQGTVVFVAVSEFVSVVTQHSGMDRRAWPGQRVLTMSPGQICCLLPALCPSWILWQFST